jgi:hypothetical protein
MAPKSALPEFVTQVRYASPEATKLADGRPWPVAAQVDVIPADPAAGLPIVELAFEVVEGDPVVTHYGLRRMEGGPAITAADLRSGRFADMVTIGRMAVAATHYLRTPRSGDELQAGYDAAVDAENARSYRHKITDAFLRDVARIARQNPDMPSKGVALVKHTSHRNAVRWIRLAEERGYLPRRDER